MRLFVLTLAFMFACVQLGNAQPIAEDSFEASGEQWTVKLKDIKNFDSDFAHEAIEVKSDSETTAFVQPAWIGDNPGDLGPLWIIQTQDEEVLGACWSFYDSEELECVPLDVPFTLALD